MAHIGKNIAKLRGLRRLTQKEMAAKINLAQPEYSKIEQKAEIDDDLLMLIANALDVTPDAIKNFNEEAAVNFISSTLTLNDNASSFNNYPIYNFNLIEKFLEMIEENKQLYERLLKEKEDVIAQKDDIIEMFKKQQKAS